MSKRFTHDGIVIVDHLKKDLIHIDGDENLLDLVEYVAILQYENEQLKQQIKDLYKFVKYDVDNEIDVYPKSILEHLVNILKIIGDVE